MFRPSWRLFSMHQSYFRIDVVEPVRISKQRDYYLTKKSLSRMFDVVLKVLYSMGNDALKQLLSKAFAPVRRTHY